MIADGKFHEQQQMSISWPGSWQLFSVKMFPTLHFASGRSKRDSEDRPISSGSTVVMLLRACASCVFTCIGFASPLHLQVGHTNLLHLLDRRCRRQRDLVSDRSEAEVDAWHPVFTACAVNLGRGRWDPQPSQTSDPNSCTLYTSNSGGP